MSSARSIRSNSVASNGSRQGSARKNPNRSSSLMHIYSSNNAKTNKNSNLKQASKRKSLNGTFGANGNTLQTQQSARMNRSILSNSIDNLQTPVSKHSRKSSSVMLHHSSHSHATLVKQNRTHRSNRQVGSSTR